MTVSAFITTAKDRCRVCYTCVRECPAKAIRIVEGQAEIVAGRCIACGNCVRVCSQQAKQVRQSVAEVRALLAGPAPVAAIVAPSFPAEFTDVDERQLVGMLRALGFARVQEVSFGADLVARRYRDLVASCNGRQYLAASCPAVVGYVERHQPELVRRIAPIVSPMVATARQIHRDHGAAMRVVFIGPCAAKKAEAKSPQLAGEVDEALTFDELLHMLEEAGLSPDRVEPSDFDPPHGGAGGLYAISRGALQAAELEEDLMSGEIVATHGREHMIEALKEFRDGDLGSKFLEVLCCEGCIMGAGITNNLPLFNRRRRVRQYVNRRMEQLDRAQWQRDLARFDDLDLARGFQANDQRIPSPAAAELEPILRRIGKHRPADELNCGACGYETCREHARAIYCGLAESEMCLPHTIEQLRTVVRELEESHQQLASTQAALVQSEKLASMGQLAAGIAHEVNNPLGVVVMYAHLLLDEMDAEAAIRDDLKMIVEQADRCKKIVSGLLHFARQNKVARFPTDIPALVDGVLRANRIPPRIAVSVENCLADPIAEVDRDQIAQVLTNLVTNALAAMEDRGRLTVHLSGDADRVRIRVQDTGCGIPEENLKKIFEPFFTTKQMGKGTGLGLAVSYGIVKMHCGDLRVESNADPGQGPTGSVFTVTLPRRD